MKIDFSDNELRRIQLIELDMLVELDRVCRKHNINYIISWGTFLGAVRHKGFIPWDDDADVDMLREDYERFKTVASELNPQICSFQDHSIESSYRWGYGKILRTGTEYIRVGHEHLENRKCVFIDVFPNDDVSQSYISSRIEQFICFVARKITYSAVGKVSEKGVAKKLYALLSMLPVDFAHNILKYYIRKSSSDSTDRVIILSWPWERKTDSYSKGKKVAGFEKKVFFDREEYDFEGFKFYGPRDYDYYLTRAYGPDYMIPPSPEHRHGNSPVSYYSLGDAKSVYYKES